MHYEKFNDGSVKCIEDEIPFELPEGWAWAKINTIAFVTKLAGFEYTKNIAPSLCEDGIPLFKGKNVQNSTIVYEFESFIPESVSDELQRSQVTKKCILTPYVGTIGNIGIHNRPGKYHLGSNVGKIELYNDNVVLLEEYVVAYLQSGFGYQQLTKHMKATAQASISIEAIRDVYLPVPPANEQLRMWSSLSNALAMIERIENTELDITNLIKSTKSKILDLAIRGQLVPQDPNDEPASVLLERIRAEKEELIKQGKIKRNKKESVIFRGEDNSYYAMIDGVSVDIAEYLGFDLPDGWIWITLKDIATITSGKTPKPEQLSTNGSVPYFKVADMNTPGNEVYLRRADCYINDLYSGPVYDGGSFVFPKNGGAVLTNKKRILTNTSVVDLNTGVFTPSKLLNQDFIFFLFSSIDFSKIHKGAVIPTVDSSVIGDLIYGLPPIEEQKRIANIIKSLFAQVDQIEIALF